MTGTPEALRDRVPGKPHRLGRLCPPALRPLPEGADRLATGRRLVDSSRAFETLFLLALSEDVGDVPQLVSPAMLSRGIGINDVQRRVQSRADVGDDKLSLT